VNVIIDSDDENEEELDDTNVTLLQRRTAEKRRMNNKLYRRRKESHAILMRIVNNPNTSDGYSIRHTLKTRQQLLEYLKMEFLKITISTISEKEKLVFPTKISRRLIITRI
jgi:hypothetical protein